MASLRSDRSFAINGGVVGFAVELNRTARKASLEAILFALNILAIDTDI